jgi:MYXO-CTERM domain-containing protein
VSPGEDVVSSAQDVVITLPDAGKASGDDVGPGTYINPSRGCECSTPQRSTPAGALFVTAFGLAALRRRRRR